MLKGYYRTTVGAEDFTIHLHNQPTKDNKCASNVLPAVNSLQQQADTAVPQAATNNDIFEAMKQLTNDVFITAAFSFLHIDYTYTELCCLLVNVFTCLASWSLPDMVMEGCC